MAKVDKTSVRIASLVVLGLLVVSAVMFSEDAGEVLGVNEKNKGEISSTNSDGEISSGARDVKNEENEKRFTGKVLWDETQTVEIISGKFEERQTIKVETDESVNYFVVDQHRDDLGEETVLIVNTETYQKLGGDPESEEPLIVTISQD